MCSSCGYLSAFPSSGEGSGEEYAPLSRHHVGNRACVAARLRKKTPQPTPSLVTGISWGCLRSLTAMRARFRAFQHGQQSQDMTGSACRFWRGLCVRAGSMLARRVSQVLGPRRPWLAGPREAEGVRAGEAGLDLSKEHLRTQELESCAPVADTFGLSFLRGGVRGRSTPPCLAIT